LGQILGIDQNMISSKLAAIDNGMAAKPEIDKQEGLKWKL